MEKISKILIAIDGSDQSMQAVRYISRFIRFKKTKIVLIHILFEVPESFLDLRNDPTSTSPLIKASAWKASAWNAKMKNDINKHMEEAEKIFLNAGYPKSSITKKIQKRKVGIARDLIKESLQNYSAVVVGRCGISKLKDVVVGTIAHKLVSRIDWIPVIVVGGKPDPNNVLIAFDGSEGSLKGVDCACSLMASEDREVMLCHVIRSLNIQLDIQKFFNSEQEQKWLQKHYETIENNFLDAEKRLSNAGFLSPNIYKSVLTSKRSRAAAITSSARNGGFGTIVLGRKGLTKVEEFLMGRVSRKVLHMADKMAVWIV